MFSRKEYELPITKDYIAHWGMLEGIREIIQNALDSESPFEWEFTEGVLSIHSRYSKLEPKTLLLGSTTKADNKDQIGAFGEGYKLALLVLHRCGYPIRIINNDTIWTPEFRFNTRYETDILYIVESKTPSKHEGVTFEISGLSHEDMGEIKMSCLNMQEHIGERKITSKGRILIEQQGRLYVGGLFICDVDTRYGYDIKPEFVTLERDRHTIDSWDLSRVTKDMWFETNDFDLICEGIEKELPDFKHAQYGSPEVIKEAVYRHFRKKNPDAVLAQNQKELEALVEQNLNVYVVGPIFHAVVSSSSSYKEENKRALNVRAETPTECLKKWFKENRQYLRRQAIVSMKEVINKSKDWKSR